MYFKILNESLIHHGFEYKEGLNIDTVKFNPDGDCLPGGLYYTNLQYLLNFAYVGTLVADVKVPQDAKVYQSPAKNKWKADKIIISNVRPLLNFINNELKENDYENLLKHNGLFIKFIKNPSQHLYFIAVQQNGLALQFVPFECQTEKMCLQAAQQNGVAIQYAHPKFKTNLVCEAAIIQSKGVALWHIEIENQTEELCLKAIKFDPYVFRAVKKQTKPICIATVEQDGLLIRFVQNIDQDIFNAACKTESAYVVQMISNYPKKLY